MTELKLSETNYSLALILPKKQFFIWLEKTLENSNRRVQDFYFEEEDLACLIPPIHTLGSPEALTVFLSRLKVKMLEQTLGAVGTEQADCPELSSKTFDEFFDLKIRDKIWVVT